MDLLEKKIIPKHLKPEAKSELKNSEAFLYEVDFKIKEFKWKNF